MKSIKQQYIDLKEGKMTQSNFMRNVRMTLPQYVTNVTSFKDTVQILKNKAILTEADIKGNSSKEQYSHFSEDERANFQEVKTGIKIEHDATPSKPYEEIEKIVLKNIKKNPDYYTNYKLTGIRDFKPETMGNVNPDDRKMKPYAADKVIDKAMGMKSIKGVEKIKASANKAHKETNELVKGVQELTHKSKRAKGIKGTMDMTGGKMKKVKIKESYGDFVAQKKAEETAAELAAETHNGFRRGDKVNVDPEAAHSLGLDPNKTYTIEDFQLSGKGLFKSVDAILDKKAYIKTIYSTTPDGSVSVKYLIKAEDTLKERLASIVRKELIEALGIGGGDNMLDVDGFMMDTSTNDELFEAKASSLAVGEKFKMSGDLGKFVTGEEVTVVSIKPYGNDLQIVLSNGKDKDDFYVDKNDEL
jgi:hypothetical protein